MMLKDDYSSASEEYTNEPDKYDLEKALRQTIVEFSCFVAAITVDLEKQEKEAIKSAKQNNEELPYILWKDSTFKINFAKGLLMHLFKPERLIKYYVLMVLPMKPWLESRDINFFVKNEHIYPGVPQEDIKFFKDLWLEEDALTETEKDTCWEFFDTLIEIAEDWHRLTGWEPEESEKLIIPNIDYEKAEAFVNGEDVDLGEREVYAPAHGGGWIMGGVKPQMSSEEYFSSSDEN